MARQCAAAISPLLTLGSRNTKRDARPLRLFPRHESRLFTSRRLSPFPARRRSLVEQPQARPTGFSRDTNHDLLTMHCKGAARTRCGPLGAPVCGGHIASSDPRVAEHETRNTAFTLVPETRITALYEPSPFPLSLPVGVPWLSNPSPANRFFTKHESRNTNHGFFRVLRPSCGEKCGLVQMRVSSIM